MADYGVDLLPSPCYYPLLTVLLALEGFPPAAAASSVFRKSRDRDGLTWRTSTERSVIDQREMVNLIKRPHHRGLLNNGKGEPLA